MYDCLARMRLTGSFTLASCDLLGGQLIGSASQRIEQSLAGTRLNELFFRRRIRGVGALPLRKFG